MGKVGFTVDESKYPGEEHQRNWIRCFLECKLRFEGNDGEVYEREVEDLYVEENKMALVKCSLKMM